MINILSQMCYLPGRSLLRRSFRLFLPGSVSRPNPPLSITKHQGMDSIAHTKVPRGLTYERSNKFLLRECMSRFIASSIHYYQTPHRLITSLTEAGESNTILIAQAAPVFSASVNVNGLANVYIVPRHLRFQRKCSK